MNHLVMNLKENGIMDVGEHIKRLAKLKASAEYHRKQLYVNNVFSAVYKHHKFSLEEAKNDITLERKSFRDSNI